VRYIGIDIETTPDKGLVELFESSIKPDVRLKDPIKRKADIESKIKAGRKTMSTSQDFSEIACIGIKEIGRDSEILQIEEMVSWLFSNINPSTTFITFNGKSFDIPVLIKNGIKKGLDLPYRQLSRMTSKYRADNHIDLMQELDFNTNSYKTMNHYMAVYLGVEKETQGDEFFATATQEELEQHCMDDLIHTEMLFEKFRDII
jgi:predicted PolB exonuclease-like 3'-5' exonuclease